MSIEGAIVFVLIGVIATFAYLHVMDGMTKRNSYHQARRALDDDRKERLKPKEIESETLKPK